jgi:hypothetical protein
MVANDATLENSFLYKTDAEVHKIMKIHNLSHGQIF